MENQNYKFEWKTIILMAVIFAIVQFFMIFILILISSKGSIDPLQSSMTLLLGIFIIIPLIIGFLVAKKVQIEKIKQAGLSAFLSMLCFFIVGLIFYLKELSTFLEPSIILILLSSFYLGKLGAFIQIKLNKNKSLKEKQIIKNNNTKIQ